MKKLLYIVLCIGGISAASAGDCDWATVTPPDDAKYKYFVAKSYSETSASDAANKAEQDIDAQIGRLFGTKLDVQSEFYSDEIGASGTTRSYERAIGMITLKGLERQRSDVEETTDGWTGCVQYRYLKSEINAEKQRLQSMSSDELQASLRFTEVVGDTQCRGTPVEIVTVPAGAYVTIDNGRYQGSAPIKFGNVCNGKYTLEITKENYEPITEQLIVPTSGRITKTLKRGIKTITVRTSLGDSNIAVNGVDYGKEPIKFNAPLGIEQSITATNAEAAQVTQTRTFSYESDDEYTISMSKLPGKIDFSAFKVRNPGVEIKVDGNTVTGNVSKELSSTETHKVSFSKSGFYNITDNIEVTGGETIYYPSQTLQFSKHPDATSGLFGGLGVSAGSGTFGYNFELGIDYKTKYFYTSVGAQINYMKLSKATMTYDYFFSHTADIDMSYWEILYLNLGFNVGRKLSIFGIGSLGLLSINALNSATSASLNVNDKLKPMFRYGLGLQYSIPLGQSGEWGIRLSYLTGKTHLSPSDITFSYMNNYDNSTIDVGNQVFDSYPEQISSFNITFFLRGFTAL